MDVNSLYTNIPHEEGIDALRHYLSSNDESKPTSDTLCVLTELVLKNNFFEFNNKHYIQVQGTAMGTKMAPNYANIFMGHLENRILECTELKPILWLRYIDDIFMLWPHGLTSLNNFLDHINNFHPTIKFTHSYSSNQIHFLDVSVHLDINKLTTKLYKKPTDRKQYLHFKSCHPKHSKRGIPYAQLLRIKRICSKEQDFISDSTELMKSFSQRGYPKHILDSAISKATSHNRASLLETADKTTDRTQGTPLILTYTPLLPNINNILKKHFNILQTTNKLKDIFPVPPRVTYRRTKNLKSLLVHSKFGSNTAGCSPCGSKKCINCAYMTTTDTVSSSSNGFNLKIKTHITCATENIIYLIHCKKCQLQYVGESSNSLRTRLTNHRFDINSNRDTPVGRHFNLPDHSLAYLQVTGIESNFKSNIVRKQRESYNIHKMNTLMPKDLKDRKS